MKYPSINFFKPVAPRARQKAEFFPGWIDPARFSGFWAGFWVENSGSGSVPGLNLKSGPGSGPETKFLSGSKKPGSKISRPDRPARCRALVATSR